MTHIALTLCATSLPRPFDVLDPDAPRPVGLSLVQWDAQGTYGQAAGLIRQEDKSISASASKAHGINDRQARSRGVFERTAIAWITNSLRGATHLVGWSLSYDLDVIRAALHRNGGNPDSLIRPGLIKIDLQQICTPIVGQQDDSGQDVPPTLEAACKALALDAETMPEGMIRSASLCRVIYARLCSSRLIADQEQAA